MTTKEIRTLVQEIVREVASITNQPRCEWITEEKAIEEFPFTKDTFRKMRLSAELEFNYHWKYTTGVNRGRSAGRAGSVIYHRSRIIEYIESI